MYTVMQVLSEAVNQSSFRLWERSPQNVIRWKVKWDIFNKKIRIDGLCARRAKRRARMDQRSIVYVLN